MLQTANCVIADSAAFDCHNNYNIQPLMYLKLLCTLVRACRMISHKNHANITVKGATVNR